MVSVCSLFLYPVKSCRGLAVTTAEVTRFGFLHDREFLVVDEEGGFLTQRTTPGLALVETELCPNDSLKLSAPKLGALTIPLAEPDGQAPRRMVKIWHDTAQAIDVGDEPAAFFSTLLGRPCRLVRRGTDFRRDIPPEKVPEPHQRALGNPLVSFADAYPFLLVSEESLANLNSRLDVPVPVDRFRPNLVVRGCHEPYAEDTWQVIQIGTITFRHGGPCVRCVVTTTDQRTLARSPEPLRTLASYRRAPKGGVIFAMNFFSEQDQGRVSVGDKVRVHQ